MADLASGLDKYLKLRRTMGYKLESDERILASFVDFIETYELGHLSLDAFNRWFSFRSNAPIGEYYCHCILSVVRLFSEYWAPFDPKSDKLPREIKMWRRSRTSPHIYTDEEVQRLLRECLNLYSIKGLRKFTFYTAFGLIMTCGLRRSEALCLNNEDVDLKKGILHIRDTKFNKNRSIPIHETTLNMLKKYDTKKRQVMGPLRTEAFFVSEQNGRISKDAIGAAFRTLVKKSGLKKSNVGPRIHDLRHTFAVNTLTHWLRSGQDVRVLIPLLSTYMGHKKPSATYWYFSATKEILQMALAMRDVRR